MKNGTGGLNIISNEYLPKKTIKDCPVEWRSFWERWFTLPWKPFELFKYEDVTLTTMLLIDESKFRPTMLMTDKDAFLQIKNIKI